MESLSYNMPVTDRPDPDAMATRPVLATLTKARRVKLRLSEEAYREFCQMVGVLATELGKDVDAQPVLDRSTVRSRAGLALLMDLWEDQLKQHQVGTPPLVTVTTSRCEAHELWELWLVLALEPSQVPGLAAVMHELDHLLR
jgi:hypothetical protein